MGGWRFYRSGRDPFVTNRKMELSSRALAQTTPRNHATGAAIAVLGPKQVQPAAGSACLGRKLLD